MKFKYCFAIIVTLIVLFSLTSVVAGENITGDAHSLDKSLAHDISSSNKDLSDKLSESQVLADKTSSNGDGEDAVDVSLNVSFKNVQKGNQINCAGFEIPWTITVKVNNGTAHNVKVYETITKEIEYTYSNATIGTFDTETGIWDIGTLSSTDNATLKLVTKLKVNGTYRFITEVKTSSYDPNLGNNILRVPIKSQNGTGNSSNVTNTQGDDNKHDNQHQQSTKHDDENIREKTTDKQDTENQNEENKNPERDTKTDDDSNGDADHNSNGNGNENKNPPSNNDNNRNKGSDTSGTPNRNKGSDSNGGSNSISKTILTENNVESISKTVNSFVDSVINIFNPNSSNDSNSNSSGLSQETVKAIKAYNYTTIPIMIFSAFLLILLGIVAYDKIKS